ncbi:MAG TPA: 4-alpha-glucanotransferase, partial [Flexilinea sp.]|nr:4-alpha-glucanotransferase [Flexilinea sp.]
HAFRQFLFFRQWLKLKQYANSKGITIVGDIPIFVSMDSSDVWSNPHLFYLDSEGHPTVVAGVPPDYFSPTGQLWGNPLYKWPEHERTDFDWWVQRIKATLLTADLIRLDHFRGFNGYWEVPSGELTAIKGRWVEGAGSALLKKLKDELGDLPIIAEDLGEITQDVVDLRDSFGLPGMKILQFAFSDDARNLFLPHNYIQNCIAYTGTHDNDTAIGWYQTAPESEKDFARRYLMSNGEDIAWKMVRCVWSSVAVYAIAPLQDILQQGPEARMNFPGKAEGNWCYQFKPSDLTPELAFRIRELNTIFNRIPEINRIPIQRPIIKYMKP